ncbi:reverse transcriptase domain-containing protein [Tanacetum coccineum]
MTSHVGSYDGKGDPNNYLHLFEWAIRMKKWVMHVTYHMFTYKLKDSSLIWWISHKAGSILSYEDLKANIWSHFSHQKKFTKTHIAVHNIKQREGESTRAFVTRYTDDTLQILGSHEDQRIFRFVHGLRTRKLVKFLSTDLPTTYKGLMEKTYTWIEAREVATNGAPNDQREGFDRPRDQDTTPVEAPILMISKDNQTPKRKSVEESVDDVGEITFPPVSNINSSDTVIIKARISGRQVNRVYIDSGSSCEVIYEHCFLKLNPSIRSLQIDSKTLLVGFSEEHSWPLGEVPLEITIGDSPYIRTEILNFVIVRSNSPYNLLLRRIAIQRMGIVVSTIHGAIKFYTPKGIGIVFSTRESDKAKEEQKKLKGISQKTLNGILSYVDAKERIVVNEKYLEQTIVIGKQLPTNFKIKLQGLLRANADVFAWTYAHMTGIPRTIMVGGEPYNT